MPPNVTFKKAAHAPFMKDIVLALELLDVPVQTEQLNLSLSGYDPVLVTLEFIS